MSRSSCISPIKFSVSLPRGYGSIVIDRLPAVLLRLEGLALLVGSLVLYFHADFGGSGVAADYSNDDPTDLAGSSVVALSQSGETPDVVQYVERARELAGAHYAALGRLPDACAEASGANRDWLSG